MNNQEFGEILKRHRRSNGFKSQRQFADKVGISSATLSRIEAGVQRPSPETIKAISKHLKDISYEDLMEKAGYLEAAEKIKDLGSLKDHLNTLKDLDPNLLSSTLALEVKKVLSILTENGEFKPDISNDIANISEIAKNKFGDNFILTPQSFIDLMLEVDHDGPITDKSMAVLAIHFLLEDLAEKEITKMQDLIDILKKTDLKYNGYPLDKEDTQRIVEMLSLLFPRYK
ncbi:helix-turn-helix domain-containing protein [Paenibacillus senegalensis]|uniref:helix-turn-helix domain-containing protein n=1 Tax=Paenibacillus senegalensis TaxID=1465766 RepID=UPI000289A948|nr:helix-turn-helix transcriptional regulator [Paenibacillus senegalensis]